MQNELSVGERTALREVASSCLCQKSRNAARAFTRFYDRYYAGSGVEPTQFNLLVAIRLSEPVSLIQLAGYAGLERTTLTRNLDVLERNGTQAGSDARQRLISLTQNGRRSLKANLSQWKKAQTAAISLLGKADFDRLLDALSLSDKLTKN
jgi:DNA-binding MarR family transcriptional regulator